MKTIFTLLLIAGCFFGVQASGQTAPVLSPASNATVDNSFDLTFTDDGTWQSSITSVSIGATTLSAGTDYTISAGKITLIPTAANPLHIPGTYTITVSATGYSDATVDQTIDAGVPTSLTVTTQPTGPPTSGGQLATQPQVTAKDQFGNLVSASFAVVATVGSGQSSSWTLGGTKTINTNSSGAATYTDLKATNLTNSAFSATITFTCNGISITSSSFNIPTLPHPSLTADPNATVDNTFAITFSDDASWRGAITDITVDGTALSTSAYSNTSGGQIIFNPANDALLRSPGTKSIVIAATGYSDATVSQTIDAGVPFTLNITTQPGAPGSSGGLLSPQPVVTAKDKFGNLVSGSFAVVATVGSGQGSSWTLGGTKTINTNSSGAAVYTDLKATNLTNSTFTATITFTCNGISITSSSFNIPTLPHPVLTADPNATVDNTFAITFSDDASWRGAITDITVDGTALSTSAYSTTSAGQIIFNPAIDVLLRSSGTKSIVIAATGYSDATVSQTIDAGVPFTLSITTQPGAPGSSGGQLSPQPVVTAKDKYGNLVSGSFAVVATVTSGQGSSWTLSGTKTINTNGSGAATYTDLKATNLTNSAFSATITFTCNGISITSSSFSIPTLPHPSLTADPNATVDNTFAITFSDDANWRGAITDITVDGTALSTSAYSNTSGGQIIFNPANDALLRSPGTKTIVIAATGYSDATVSQTIDAGAPVTLNITTQPGAPGSSGGLLSPQPVITAKDKYNNLVSGSFAVVASVSSGQGSSWTLGGTKTINTNSSGAAVYTDLKATNLTNSTISATITFTCNGISITSSSFNIPTLPHPVLTADPNATVDNTFAITFSDDANWRGAITDITVNGTTLSTSAYSTTSAGQIIFNPVNDALLRSPGTKSIVIAATGYSDATVSQTIDAGVPVTLNITTQPGAPGSSGGLLSPQPVITAKDKYGNLVSGSFAVVASVSSGQGSSWTLGGTKTINTNSSGAATYTDLKATNVTNSPFAATITFTCNGISITSSSFIIPTLPHPSLTADPNATVDNTFAITFSDDASWRGAITLITVDGSVLSASAYSTTSAGQIIFTPSASSLLKSPGTKSIVIAATGYSDATVSQTIDAGVPVTLNITTQPGAPGSSGGLLSPQPVVAAKDQYGNLVSASFAVVASVSSGQGSSWTLGGTTTVNTNSSGAASFSNLTATNLTNSAFTATITFTCNGISITSSSFNIPTLPSPVLTAAPGATVDNSFNITFPDNASWRGAITSIKVNGTTTLASGTDYTISTGQITLIPTASNPFHTPGTYTITVAATGYSDATVSQTVSAGVPASISITTQPGSPSSSGGTLSPQPVITARDKYSNLVSGSFAVVASIPPAQVGNWTLGGTTSVNTSSGSATFVNLSATNLTNSAYTANLIFTCNGISLTSSSFIIPTLPSPTLTVAPGAIVDNPFNITFSDNASWRGAIKSVTVGATTLTLGTDYTISAGQITLIPTASNPLHIPGTYTITVAATGYSDATVSQTISAGVPVTLNIAPQPGAPGSSGGLLSPQPVVNAKDKYGNLVSGNFAVVATVTSGQGSSWTLGGTTTVNTNSSGAASFSNLTATNLTNSAYTLATITFTCNGKTVTSAPPFTIPTLPSPLLTPAPGATVDNPFNITFTDNASWRGAITSIKVNGITTLAAGTDYTVSAGTITLIPTAANPFRTPGNYTITVAATGYSDATVNQTISAGVPASLTVNPQPTGPTTSGGTLAIQPSITARDKYTNLVTGSFAIIASVTSGQTSSWSLGGTTTVNTNSSGVATYTGLTATNLTLNNYNTATITFSYGSVTVPSTPAFTVPAPPPANDNCSGAITLTPAVSPTAVSGTFLSATASSALGYDNAKGDVWYVFTPTCTSLHTVTANFTSGAGKDVDLDVFTGGSCPSSGTATVIGHNNANNSSSEAATGQFTAGTTYYIRVIDHGGTSAGTFTIGVTINAPAQPSAITGNNAPCLGSTENYTVSPVAGVIYTWNLPSGWTGSSTTNTIQTVVGNSSGTISVTPSNTCGLSGTAQTLAITPNTTPQNVPSASISPDNGRLVVSWTNPSTCFDEIMVVATSNANVTLIPTGDGSLYIDTTEYASQNKNNAQNMNTGEYCIYKGTATSTIITGLLNGNSYTIKIYTRWGTQWSSGVQYTNNVPVAVSNGSYKSIKSGLWTDNTIWQKSQGSNWIPTSGKNDYPNATSSDVFIESGTVVQLDATLVSVRNLTVKTNGQVWTSDPDQAGNKNKYVAVFGSFITCDGTIGSLKTSGNQADNICFDMEGTNITVSGTGTFGCGRIRKNFSGGDQGGTDATTLNIGMDINIYWKGNDLYNNADQDKNHSTTFNVNLNNPYKVSLNHPTADIGIDGDKGANGNSRTGGTYSINGTLNITGTLYLTTDNGSGGIPCKINIGATGKVYTNKVESPASGVAQHSLTISNGGLLNIKDANGFNNYSTTNNVINLGVTSTVEYAATATGQQVQSGLTYGNLTAMGTGEKIVTTDFSSLTVSSNLGIVSGNTFNLNDRTIYLNGTVNGLGTITGSNKSNIVVGPSGTQIGYGLGVLRFTAGRDSLNTLTMDRKMPTNTYPSQKYWGAVLGTGVKVSTLTLNQGILATDKNLLTLNSYPSGAYSTINKVSYVATTDTLATAFNIGNTFDASFGLRIKGVKANTPTYFPVGADFVSPNRMMVTMANNASTRDLTVALTKGDIGSTGSPRANRLWYMGSSVNDSINSQVQLFYTGYDVATYPYMTKQDELETGFIGSGVRLVEKTILSNNYFTNISNAPANVLFNGSPNTEVYAKSNTADSVYNGTHPGIFKYNIFSIVDGDQVVLPVTFISIRAYQQGSGVGINWSVANEVNIDHYEIERAGDGRLFSVVNTQQAQNSGSAGNSYTVGDKQPLTGTNYYRIKAIGKDRQVLYSAVVNITTGSDGKAAMLVYPNPVRNSACNVQLTNLAAGTYNIGIYSMAGQLIALKQLEHAGGSSSLKLNLPAGTAAGVYIVRLSGSGISMQTSVFVSGK